MLTPQFILPIHGEIVVDLFAGGGGASTGIEQAIGRNVDVAINHDPQAVALHQANHPQTLHFVSDVFEVDPVTVADGRPIGLLWASPDCKHFSKAKGGKPVSKKIRSLAWVVVKWARKVQPRMIFLENVEEFQTWGPLAENGRPCPQRKGATFQRWVGQLRAAGYAVEWRELRACDFGAPTIRKRLFLIARRDGLPIQWPEPTHGPGRRRYRTAADVIDWSHPCPSIFERERPLADATMRRIAHGIKRYVLNNPIPFVVRIGHTGHGDSGKVRSVSEPVSTVTTKAEHLLVSPTLGPVVSGGQKHAIVAAFLAKHYGGNETPGWPLDKPISTITTQDHHALVECRAGDHGDQVRALLVKYYGNDRDGQSLGDPLHTVPTRDRFGLVTVAGVDYEISDIGMRMLQPRELYRAQGFPDSYVIDRGADGRVLPKDAQVRMCGNSVCPPIAAALVRANWQADKQARAA